MRQRYFWIIFAIVLFLVCSPYILGLVSGGTDFVFSGFLLNPMDGNTYLAKMYQGWQGNWRFTLPYTSEPGEGAYLFGFYLLLGHFSKLINLPLLLMFHLARILAGLFMLASLWRFLELLLVNDLKIMRRVFLLASIGSGMGWAVIIFGKFSSDFWVAEAFPFLSFFANPHFPLGISLVLWGLIKLLKDCNGLDYLLVTIIGLFLAIVVPYGFVLLAGIYVFVELWNLISQKRIDLKRLSAYLLLGGPFILYQYYAVLNDPILANWNRQNQTPAPPLWDILIAFSPPIILAIIGLVSLWKQKNFGNYKILVAWFILGLCLIFIPFNLQRRFIFGFYIPTSALAVIGFQSITNQFPLKTDRIWNVLLALSVPTNLIVIFAGIFGIISHSSSIFLTRNEFEAIRWLKENAPVHSLILASPDIGLFIPAYSGQRVIYGHPFETINAKEEKKLVEKFFEGKLETTTAWIFLEKSGIEYVFWGPRERILGNPEIIKNLTIQYKNQEVSIFSLR